MPLYLMQATMGATFLAVWLIVAQIIVGDRSSRRREEADPPAEQSVAHIPQPLADPLS